MKPLKVFSFILLMAAAYFGSLMVICSSSMDMAMASTLWDTPPPGWHIRMFGWHGLLIINMVCTFVVGGAMFFALFWLPRRLDKHVNDNGDDTSRNDQ